MSKARVPIMIDPEVRTELKRLLHEDHMRGVGYSDFISSAITRTRQETRRKSEQAKRFIEDGSAQTGRNQRANRRPAR